MKKNCVLLLTDKLITGGAEIYFCRLENHLQAEQITVYSAAAPGELYEGIQQKQNFIKLSLNNHLANIITLTKKVRKLGIDVIHANSLRMLFYSIAIKKLTGRKIKIVYTKHNLTILEKKSPSIFKKVLNQHADSIIAVSQFEKENLIRLDVNSELIRTIYNGVDVDQFSFQQIQERKSFNIGILARMSKEKNHELFIGIANELKEFNNLTFFIAGDGPERESIKKLISDLELGSKVKLLGNISNPYEFICNMDLILLTSHREVFPMVVLEAMAAGTPLVSVDVGGVKEAIMNFETGILISRHSANEFSKQIKLLYSNMPLRQKISETARQKVTERFSLSTMIRATLETYQE